MKALRIKQNEYANLEALLNRAGLLDKSNNMAFPEHLFVNEKTYKRIPYNKIKKYDIKIDSNGIYYKRIYF